MPMNKSLLLLIIAVIILLAGIVAIVVTSVPTFQVVRPSSEQSTFAKSEGLVTVNVVTGGG